MMRESPRTRRLRSDFRLLQQLARESTIFSFSFRVGHGHEPPEAYLFRFRGRGLCFDTATGCVALAESHEVSVELGASYPRLMPQLTWRSPIFHPNISASGIVCLGGYAAHWVPSLHLAELARMLWDMVRYQNYDVDSPYNREAAAWVRRQTQWRFPLDDRPVRDRYLEVASRVAEPMAASAAQRAGAAVEFTDHGHTARPSPRGNRADDSKPSAEPDIIFLD